MNDSVDATVTGVPHEVTTPEDLGDRLRRGDRQAFETFYEDFHPAVYNLAARITGDRETARDITQDVFFRSLDAFPRGSGPLKPQAWIMRATVNACHDHLRRRGRRPTEPLEAAGEVPAPVDPYQQSAMAGAVEDALLTINPRYRTALLLKELQGLSNGEVAAAMGVGRGTVGVLLLRARGAFKRAYRQVAADGAGVPALALVLAPLPVPAALSTPPFAAMAASPASVAALLPNAEPFATGLARLVEPLLGKAAIVVAAATVAAGAGVVAGVSTAPSTGERPDRAPTATAASAYHDDETQVAGHHAEARHAAHLRGMDDRDHNAAEGDGHAGEGTHDGAGGSAPHTGEGVHDGSGGAGDAGHTGDGGAGTDAAGEGTGDGTHAGEVGTSGHDGDTLHDGQTAGDSGGRQSGGD